jgi:hypothetical protein
MVQLPTGERNYFYCNEYDTDKYSCGSDDHYFRGNLLHSSGYWYYLAADGTTWALNSFSDDAQRFWWSTHADGGGNLIAQATYTTTISGTNSRLDKVATANSSLYFKFTYDSSSTRFDIVHINAASSSAILDFTVANQTGWYALTSVLYANEINSFDDQTTDYGYDSSTKQLEQVSKPLGGSTAVVAEIHYDLDGWVSIVRNATMDLNVTDRDATTTTIEYTIEGSSGPETTFTHNGSFVKTRDSEVHVGGMSARTEVRNEIGQVTCRETDDSRTSTTTYTRLVPTQTDIYGKTGSCAGGATIDRKIWQSWELNALNETWRPVWTRRKSIYNGASDCTGSSLPSGARRRSTSTSRVTTTGSSG